jgi:hypothetical protein
MRKKYAINRLIIISLLIFSVVISMYLFDIAPSFFIGLSMFFNDYILDNAMIILILLLVAALVFTFRRIVELNKIVNEAKSYSSDLHQALSEVKYLQGILSICQHCKSIRSDEGDWERLETYVMKHTDAKFSHGICPGCLEEHHSLYIKSIKSKNNDS